MTILSEGKNIQKIKSMGIYMSGDLYIVLPEPLNEINLRRAVTQIAQKLRANLT